MSNEAPEPMGRAKRFALLAAGAGALILAGWLAGRTDTEAPAATADPQAGEEAARATERLGHGREGRARPGAHAGAGPDAGAGPAVPRFPSEAVREVRASVARRMEDFRSESIDPEWARESTTRLRGDLREAVRGTEGELVGLECRTSTCVATVSWPTYGLAFRSYRHLLIQPYRVSCRRSMSVPPPEEERGGAYEAHMFLDCDRSSSEEERG
ncbi:MAG TPA: hypothetical protein RMH99_27305 [Sandaracinaceae bacterium LLY-WYZ-13_1]|nr:hypothetical protein [Sandaracinaceae bacterium LLY-WYZ-13_1]